MTDLTGIQEELHDLRVELGNVCLAIEANTEWLREMASSLSYLASRSTGTDVSGIESELNKFTKMFEFGEDVRAIYGVDDRLKEIRDFLEESNKQRAEYVKTLKAVGTAVKKVKKE